MKWTLSACIVALAASCVAAAPATSRETISINADWRFTKNDPTNIDSRQLLYDVRPLSRGADQRERLAEATEEAAHLPAATHPLLTPWILPTANPVAKDPAKRLVRPGGNPGGDVPYV